ncbi:hypothetical protein Mapa_014431 [Marchantia paleacea]|nr:hypothetical protein Mapa_014431 [Marchantia paleacea]
MNMHAILEVLGFFVRVMRSVLNLDPNLLRCSSTTALLPAALAPTLSVPLLHL